MKREHKFIDRHVKKRWSRARVNAQKSLRRMQGQHDAIMREIQMTPMQRITRIVVGAGVDRSLSCSWPQPPFIAFPDNVFPNSAVVIRSRA